MRPKSIAHLLTAVVICGFAAVVFVAGIDWGLPSRNVDWFLFGSRADAWSGAKIASLAPQRVEDKQRGVDLATGPALDRTKPVAVNADDCQRAAIIRRYRLFTHQPDEMITLMSLAAMKQANSLDPRMYQYGGLWIYPVGGLLKISAVVGLVHASSDVTYYLDHPEEFGRFYVVARLYSAAWGVVGAWAVYWILRRLTGRTMAGGIGALGYACLPVVINMAHEAKPHLAGAVLSLLAMMAAMKYLETHRFRWACITGVLCGAAVGMVLSVWPVGVVMILLWLPRATVVGGGVPEISGETGKPVLSPPLVLRGRVRVGVLSSLRTSGHRHQPTCEDAPTPTLPRSTRGGGKRWLGDTLGLPENSGVPASSSRALFAALAIAAAVYLLTNPYVAINAVCNWQVIISNLAGNAMFQIAPGHRWGNAMNLIAQGATSTVALVGAVAFAAIALVGGLRHWDADQGKQPSLLENVTFTRQDLVVALPALLGIGQFIILAGGRTSEHARFALLPDIVLLIFCMRYFAAIRFRAGRAIAYIVLLAIVAQGGFWYLAGFICNRNGVAWKATRLVAAAELRRLNDRGAVTLAITAEPAPYDMPPVNLQRWKVILLPNAGNPPMELTSDVVVALADNARAPIGTDAAYKWHWVRGWPGAPDADTPISWAATPFVIGIRRSPASSPAPGADP